MVFRMESWGIDFLFLFFSFNFVGLGVPGTWQLFTHYGSVCGAKKRGRGEKSKTRPRSAGCVGITVRRGRHERIPKLGESIKGWLGNPSKVRGCYGRQHGRLSAYHCCGGLVGGSGRENEAHEGRTYACRPSCPTPGQRWTGGSGGAVNRLHVSLGLAIGPGGLGRGFCQDEMGSMNYLGRYVPPTARHPWPSRLFVCIGDHQ